ncbi:MAG: hypothetical protein GXZ15_05360 [Campylobacter sp.]|nr:hypothetical protein [Campylobacter sp.]
MLEVELFRFEVGLDYASYYKPYYFKNYNFESLRELLGDIQKSDPYFKFEGVEWVKIDDYLVNLDANLKDVINFAGKHLFISPLYQKRSLKDLIIDENDFLNTFEKFSEFKEEKEFYQSLKPLFYSNITLAFKDDFIGNSAFVFAVHLLNKFPSKKDKILNIIENDINYYISPRFMFEDPFNTNECVEKLRKELGLEPMKKSIKFIENFNDINSNVSFDGFKIAVYNDKNLENFVKSLGAKVVKFEFSDRCSGAEIYKHDNKIATAIASKIVFSAVDAGSDFLVVNDKSAFEMFEGRAKEIEKYANRNLISYYILNADELVSLAEGKNVNFTNHKLVVEIK